MTPSVLISHAPTSTIIAVTPESRLTSARPARVSRGAPVRRSLCNSGRASDRLCWSQFRLNDRIKSKQSIPPDHAKRYFQVPYGSYGEAETEAVSASTSTNGCEKTLVDAKKAVMRSVSNTNRGKNATYEQRQGILKLLQELEALNPTSNPVNSPLFSGRWVLLYTAPVDEKTADRYAGTEEGPFLARVKPAAFGSVKQTRSVQVIDSAAGVAENIAYFTVFGAQGNLNIRGSVTPAPSKSDGAVRVKVTFETFVITIGDWRSPTISLSWIKPQGWVDTTFLDNDMRVGRGDKGSIFVSSRMKQDVS